MPRLIDPLPVRSTTVWPGYEADAIIPRVYGRARVPARRYAEHGKTWVVADHALEGVDAVYDEGEPIAGWRHDNGADSTGHAVALIRLEKAPKGAISADVRGLPGAPDRILTDLYPGPDLTDLRVWAAQEGLVLGGAFLQAQTLRTALAFVVSQWAGGWSAGMPGLAGPFPPDADAPSYAASGPLDRGGLQTECSLDALVTRLVVRFDWNYASDAAQQTLTIAADSDSRWGVREAALDLPWVKESRQALAIATRWLQWRARPLWTLKWNAGVDYRDLPPGVWIDLTGTDTPMTGRVVVMDLDPGYGRGEVQITAQAPVGLLPVVRLIQTATEF